MKERKEKKKKGGCLKFIGAIFFFIILLGFAVFAGNRWLRPFALEKTAYFDPAVFGFNLPEGLTSMRVPAVPRISGVSFSVISAEDNAEEVMDRVSLSAVSAGWRPEKVSEALSDFNMDRIKDIASGIPGIPGEIAFFNRNGKTLVLTSFTAGEKVYIAVVSGGKD